VPLNRRGFVYVSYPRRSAFSGPEYNFTEIPFSQLLENAARRDQHLPSEPRLEEALQGKYVVVADLVGGPREHQATLIPEMPYGSAVVAASLRTLLLGSAVGRAPRELDARWALGLGLLGALFAFAAFRGTRTVSATLFLGVGGIGFGVYLYIAYVEQRFTQQHLWMAVFYPALAFALAAAGTAWINFGEEAIDRQRVIEALGRLTPGWVVDRILLAPHLLAPERRSLSACFLGLAGFAQVAETLPARRLGELLGELFGALGMEVRAHRGHVAQLVGDRFFALWNAPLPLEHHARHACRAALAMRDRLAKLRPPLHKEFGVEVKAGIGLATGEAVVGELGARASGGAEKSNYTAMGQVVSVAGALERACRLYGTAVLASEATFAATIDQFAWREIDRLKLPALAEPVRVFELQAEKGHLDEARRECARHYGLGLGAYQARAFSKAYEHFRDALKASPEDGPAALMLARCERYRAEPPPETWDGSAPMAEDSLEPVRDFGASGR
jgi:adenylate cyclase